MNGVTYERDTKKYTKKKEIHDKERKNETKVRVRKKDRESKGGRGRGREVETEWTKRNLKQLE